MTYKKLKATAIELNFAIMFEFQGLTKLEV